MKVCFKCGIEKPLSDYYKHKQMGDGHLNKCKTCTKKDTKRQTEINISTPEGLEKERTRHREKYYRLGYKDKHKPTPEMKKQQIDRFKKKYPEKIIIKNKSSHLKPLIKGNNLHHWSYNLEHAKSVIELNLSDHNKLHRFLKYDQKTFMYKDLNGVLLDTKEKHIEYMNKILKTF